jgi:hypothetical protein
VPEFVPKKAITMEDLNNLSDTLGEVVRILREKGFVPPIRCACITANGSFIYFEYRPGPDGKALETNVLAEHDAGAYRMPMNVVFVDNDGDAARVLIAPGGERSEIQFLS